MMRVLCQAHESLGILRSIFTFGRNGTRIYEQVRCRGCRVCVFVFEISRICEFETYEFERFGGWFIGLVLMC